jgi:hypothetical protein
MDGISPYYERDHRADGSGVLHFTPSEWRDLLEDGDFLRDPDNSYRVPRRLMGVAVEIVPDHRFG